MTRMGSMFTIPGLMLWLVWQFGTTLRERTRVGLLAITIIAGVGTTNYLLEKTYGNQENLTGSNFSYTLCGLTMGTTWDGCGPKLAEIMAQRPRTLRRSEVAVFLGLGEFHRRPWLFFERLLAGAHAFLTEIPDLLFRGYGAVIEPSWFPRTLIVTLSLIGLMYELGRRDNRRQLGFWAMLWASIVSSAAFVFFDQGRRVLASSYPLIFLIFRNGND